MDKQTINLYKLAIEKTMGTGETLNYIKRICERRFNLNSDLVEKVINLMIEKDEAQIIVQQGGDGWNTSYSYEEIALTK